MSRAKFTEETLKVKVNGREHAVVVRSSTELCDDPALVIAMANDIKSTLDIHPYCLLSDTFIAAGHRAIAIDMPCHGAWTTQYGDGIVGIAAGLKAGVDLYAELGRVASAVVDLCIEKKLARAGHIVTGGTSRGGLGALHILTADDRIAGCAMFAPVTHMPSVSEFGTLEGHELTMKSSALGLVPKVNGRAVGISMNTNDTRVSSEKTLQFYSHLRSTYPDARLDLWVNEAEGHGMPDAGYIRGCAFLLNLCCDTAKRQHS